jgi:hypothetical protein
VKRSGFTAQTDRSHASKKSPAVERAPVSVPQTDAGGQGENPKAFEITLVKELSKLAP